LAASLEMKVQNETNQDSQKVTKQKIMFNILFNIYFQFFLITQARENGNINDTDRQKILLAVS